MFLLERSLSLCLHMCFSANNRSSWCRYGCVSNQTNVFLQSSHSTQPYIIHLFPSATKLIVARNKLRHFQWISNAGERLSNPPRFDRYVTRHTFGFRLSTTTTAPCQPHTRMLRFPTLTISAHHLQQNSGKQVFDWWLRIRKCLACATEKGLQIIISMPDRFSCR